MVKKLKKQVKINNAQLIEVQKVIMEEYVEKYGGFCLNREEELLK